MAGTEAAIAVWGVFTGASLMLLITRLRPRWLGLARPSSTTERLELIRSGLLAELRDLAEKVRTPPAPIRMDARKTPGEIEQRQAA